MRKALERGSSRLLLTPACLLLPHWRARCAERVSLVLMVTELETRHVEDPWRASVALVNVCAWMSRTAGAAGQTQVNECTAF